MVGHYQCSLVGENSKKSGRGGTNRWTKYFFETLEKHWIGTGIGTNDIKITSLIRGREHGWGTYINKENYKGNEWCVDYASTQIPSHLLAY